MSAFSAAIFLIFSLVGCTSTETLDKRLLDNKTCGFQFPPPNLIPRSCIVEPPEDVKLTDSTVEPYLCLALLDIKNSVCALKSGASFNNFDKIRLNDHDEKDSKFCERMAKLNSSSANVKKLYEHLQNKCPIICSAVDEEVDRLRRAMCETLYYGHEILTRLRKAVPNNENHPSALKPEINPSRSSVQISPSLSSPYRFPQTVDGPPLQAVQLFNSSKKIDKKVQESGTGGEIALGKSDSSNLANDAIGNLPIANARVDQSNPGQNSENKLITKKNQTVDSGVEGHVEELGIRNSDVASQQGQSKQSVIFQSDAGQGDSMKNTDPHTANRVKAVAPETKKGSDGHVQDGVFESVPDKGDLNEAVETPNTNAGEEVEEVDDENIQEANHLQGETDDDDDDVGIGDKDKDKGIKANQNPKGTAQQSTKADDLSKLSNANSASGRTYGYSTFVEAEDSHFFAYFMSLSAFFIICYLAYHNKRKIIAMAVEGKKNRNTGRRRPNSASYHKLDSNLEEAMSSNVTSTNSYVIY